MKRIVLIIGALLIGLATRAQSVTYTCRYWFDQNFAQAAMATFSSSNWQAELDVGSLADGLHTLHLHVMDTSMKWSAPQNYLFLKTTATPSENYVFHHWIDQGQMHSSALGNGQFLLDVATLDSGLHTLHVMLKGSEYTASQSYIFLKPELTGFDAENWVYHCWFDEDYAHRETDSLGNGNFLLDVSDLEEGLHTLNVVLQGNSLTATQSYMFMRVEMIETGSIDMSNLTYHCWFDEDFEHQQTDSLRDGNILLNVNDLEDGLHTMNMMLEGGSGTLTPPRSYMFLKVAVEDPSLETQYHCWFDEDHDNMLTGLLGGGIFQLEVSDLSNGLHVVHVQLDKGKQTAPQSYFFYKIPFGGNGLNKWEYCINGDWGNRVTTNVVPSVDTLSIVSLLPVPPQPVRSSSFHFHPNDYEPYLNAKNEITLRFWTADDHFIDKSAFYIDEYVSEPIQADDLERNATVCIPAPRDNQMQWYKVPLVVGDSIAFKTDKACTMQLFAPSGEEVYAATASEALVFGGIHAWEDGDYYFVVHDVTGSGDEVCLTNVYVHKYAILAYDVHLVGNGGCSTITFQGNGFNSLLDAYLVNYQNDTIRRLDIGHESNTTTTVTFDFYQKNLGTYDAVFQFYGETIRVNGALEVQEPVDIVLTSSVSYPSQFLRNTACTYTYTITNNGNMSAYGVPIFTYIGTLSIEGISHIDYIGLDLPSIISDIVIDSLSASEVTELRAWAKEMGDDWCFKRYKTIDENSGDTIVIHSNYFFVTLAPFETKTLSLQITATDPLDVWFTIPNYLNALILPDDNKLKAKSSPFSNYCCVREGVECSISVLSDWLDRVSLLGEEAGMVVAIISALLGQIEGVAAGAIMITEAEAISAINCIISTLESEMKIIGNEVCEGDEVSTNEIMEAIRKSRPTLEKTFLRCLSALLPTNIVQHWREIGQASESGLGILNTILVAILGPNGLSNPLTCVSKFLKAIPNCPDGGNSDGGKSDPVNSLDPNDIYGYLSESGSHYMRQEIQNVQYEIEFENDTTLATAAAHTIIVRDTLDATKFDLNSLAARSITIGDKRLDLNGEQTFAKTLDLRPESYVIAQVEQDYDPTTGVIEWTIQSLDPMTMEPTDDPNQGVLPVNYYGDGVGFIDYSVNLREPFADGTEISNRAGIIFDQNDVIMTPTWTNIVDAVKPTSHIEEVTLMGDSLSFSFVSSDNRSGVWYHNLYYRNASTEQEWLVKKTQIHGNSFMLPFDSLQTSEYFVIAVDSAGNVEPMKMEAEVVVESNTPGYPFFVAGYGESTKAGWKFIASPIEGGIEATTVDNIFGATQYDLYRFDQSEESEWRNYKTNSFNLINGQAYLYATKEDKTLIFRGTYNETDSHEVMLMYSDDNPTTAMRGWNLIGNPFTVPAYVDRSYYTMNEEGTTIEPVAVSEGSAIPACHGVMVKAETPAETVTFSRTAQRSTPNQGNIQIVVTQATMRGNIKQDKAVVSFNSNDPLEKFVFDESNNRVYIPQNDKDYAIAYAGKTGDVPVNFKAAKDGTYSLTVNADNKVFDYLHLIDNLTGADVDLSMESTYTFEAKTTDYASRFRLVFFVSEEGDDMPFAFVNNGNIVVIGAQTDAVLQIVDMLGRVILCRDASNASAIATTGMAKGMYVLRLINGDSVKTQKIVVR